MVHEKSTALTLQRREVCHRVAGVYRIPMGSLSTITFLLCRYEYLFQPPLAHTMAAEVKLSAQGPNEFADTVQWFMARGWVVTAVFPADSPRQTTLKAYGITLCVNRSLQEPTAKGQWK